MNWHLFKKDDPNTWPEIDCPMLVYRKYSNETEVLEVHFWDKDSKQFYIKEDNWYKSYDECYYQYIGYVPNGYKVLHPDVCTDETGYSCDQYDDGYCLKKGKCLFKQEINEYALNDNKRIWKEFE